MAKNDIGEARVMGYYGEYVPVADKMRLAQKKIDAARRSGKPFDPVEPIHGRVGVSFWGSSWNKNLAAYSDYATRLPKGLSYARNGFVMDLSISAGCVKAKVMGSAPYDVTVSIDPLPQTTWNALKSACSGEIGSLIDLLQGKLGDNAMKLVCQQKTGLFPTPKEIKFKCSCPDDASLCKHVAAALYGVSDRLDRKPELLFALRGVDAKELTAANAATLIAAQSSIGSKELSSDDMGGLFDLDFDDSDGAGDLAHFAQAAALATESAAFVSNTATAANAAPAARPGENGSRGETSADGVQIAATAQRPELAPSSEATGLAVGNPGVLPDFKALLAQAAAAAPADTPAQTQAKNSSKKAKAASMAAVKRASAKAKKMEPANHFAWPCTLYGA